MKKLLILFVVLAVAAVVIISASSGTETENNTMDLDQGVADGLLGLQIKAKLLEELGWDAISIDVEVEENNLTLSGEVNEPTTKKMAKQVAKSFDGVGSIESMIEVEESVEDEPGTPIAKAVGNAEEEVKDAVLETRVKTQLLSELGRHGFKINVEAIDGVVSLRGEVPDAERREIALETARECKGVDRVIDLLEIQGA